MLALQDEEKRKGNNYNMKQIAEIAGPKYKLLPKEDKEYYEDRAADFKKTQRKEGKLDSYGNSIAQIEKEEEELMREEDDMYRAIQKRLKYLGSKKDIAEEPFYFLSTKIFCKTDEGDYLPAELGLTKYSIAQGVMNQYHCFIDPGPIPIGYSFSCKSTSEAEHKIPYQNFELANNDYGGIIEKITEVLSPDGNPEIFPPIYVSIDEMEHTKAILESLQIKAGLRKHHIFIIYDVAVLMMEILRDLKRNMYSLPLIREWLDVTSFNYYQETNCEWHFEQDLYNYCALGTAKRFCYVYSDHLCHDFGVIPTNRHLPERPQDEKAPLPRRHRFERSNTPSSKASSVHSETMSTIVKNVKSRYDDSEEKVVIQSAGLEFQSPSSSKSGTYTSGSNIPLSSEVRAPKTLSFANVAISKLPAGQQQQQYQFNDDEFPGLGVESLTLDDDSTIPDDLRSESSISIASFGNESTSSLPSVTSSWKSSQFGTSRNSNPLPIGRGIGRGRPIVRK